MQLFVERGDAVMVVQHQAVDELVADGGLQLAQAAQVLGAHSGRGFDLNANDPPAPVFDHQVHLILVFGAKVGKTQPLLGPGGDFEHF